MKFGIYLNQFLSDNNTRDDIFINLQEQALLAENIGLDSVVIGEAHFYEEGCLDPFSALSALAYSTKSIQVGTNVIILPLYNPFQVAEFGACIDAATGGRLLLGVALGEWIERLFEVHGVSKGSRVGRFKEGVEMIKRLWDADCATYQGKYYKMKDCFISPRPKHTPRPPIIIGGLSPAAIRRAGVIGDGWSCGNVPLKDFKEGARFYREGLNEVGKKEGSIAYMIDGFCAVQGAEEKVKEPIVHLYTKYQEWGSEIIEGEVDFDELKDRFAIGTPADCIERIAPLKEAGVDLLFFRTELPNMRQEDVRASMKLFADEVVGYFRGQ